MIRSVTGQRISSSSAPASSRTRTSTTLASGGSATAARTGTAAYVRMAITGDGAGGSAMVSLLGFR
jgi:hypothetical protein